MRQNINTTSELQFSQVDIRGQSKDLRASHVLAFNFTVALHPK